MAEWFADEKPSGKPYVPEEPSVDEPEPTYGITEEGDLTPAEISELSRPGYVRRDDGGFFATMEKRGQVEARRELVKPNNVSKKLASPAASSMAWPVNQPRIVDHHGQGGGQYPGNVRLR